MLTLIFLLIYTAFAETPTIYSRIYRHSVKKLENERIQADLINIGIKYIEDVVFIAANLGLVEYTTEPFLGCEVYSKYDEFLELKIDKDDCENILSEIITLVYSRFPYSELSYDFETRRYTLKWN